MKALLRVSPLLFALSSCILDLTNDIYCKHDHTVIEIDSCTLFIPNAFTPNGNGLNDVLAVSSNCICESFDLNISSLTGRSLYTFKSQQDRWDGTFDSKDVAGNVRFEINATFNGQSISEKGILSVIPFRGDEQVDLPNCDACAFGDQWDSRAGELIYNTQEDWGCE